MRNTKTPPIEIRDSAAGPQAYLNGTRLQVWWIIRVLRNGDCSVDAVARLYDLPRGLIKAALDYAAAHPVEIDAALAEFDDAREYLKELLPNQRGISVGDDAASA